MKSQRKKPSQKLLANGKEASSPSSTGLIHLFIKLMDPVLVSETADWEPGNLKKPATSSKLDREGLSPAKYTSPQLYSKQLPGYTACQAVHAALPWPRSHDSTWHQGKAMIYLETSALTALFLLLSKSKAEASPSVDIFFLNPARLPIRLPYCSVE